MANTERVDKSLFDKEHYLGKPASDSDRIVTRRIEILEQFPDFFGKDLSCIEVGCGEGSTITRLSNKFASTLGVDIFDYSVPFQKQKQLHNADNSNFKKTDLESELPTERFDRLISFEVIEHLKSEKSVKAYADVLKNGGLAAISVPNKWWIFETHGAKLPLLPWNRVPFFSWLPTPIHERFANARIYTVKRITSVLENSGFVVKYHCYVTAPMDVLKRGRLKNFLTRYIFKTNTTRNPILSTSIFLLAEKKSGNE